MQTSVIGFPRIGTLRELKFASEKLQDNEDIVKEAVKQNAISLPNFSNPAEAARAWADEMEAKQIAQQERDQAVAQVDVLQPKAQALEVLSQNRNGYLCLTVYGISNLSFYGQNSENSSFESLRLAYDKYEKNDNKALPFVQKLISKAKKENNLSELVHGYQDALYFEKNKYLKLKYADSTIFAAIKSKDNNLITSAYLGKGIIYYSNFRKYTPALNEYLKAFTYVKNSENKYLHYKVVYHLGVVKSYLGYYDEALIHFKDCIHFFEAQLKSDLHPNEVFNYKKGYLNSIHQANVIYRSLKLHKNI